MSDTEHQQGELVGTRRESWWAGTVRIRLAPRRNRYAGDTRLEQMLGTVRENDHSFNQVVLRLIACR